MKAFKLLAAAALIGSFAGTVQAADLPRSPMLAPVTPKLIPSEVGSNWYIRGDTGYTMYNDPSVGFIQSGIPFFSEKLDGAFMVGLGVGYQVNRWFRTDVTIDWRNSADFSGNYTCTCTGTSITDAKIGVSTAMWNGYIEMGSWNRFTPYVGAGIGAARVHVMDYHGLNAPYTGAYIRHPSHAAVNFAWALMAGTSYDISRNAKFDMGYRYLNLGDGRTNHDSTGNTIKYKDLSAHEFRVGLRYLID